MKIKTIESKQYGFRIFSAKLTVKCLADISEVDCADPANKKKGYQRKGKEKRFDQIASYLINKNGLMPTPILLSYRGELEKDKINSNIIELDIPAGDKLWVIDGQHRLGGLKLLAGLDKTQGTGASSKKYKKYHEEFKQFEMPVVIVECPSRPVEAALFATINGKAEKVDIFLATLAANQGGGASPTGAEAWRSRAADAVQHLNNSSSSILRGKIQHPTSPKGKYYCSAKGIMNQMKPFMNDGVIAAHWNTGSENEIYEMLENYWSAWYSHVDFCFNDSKNYALFKNSGIKALSVCLIMMIRKCKTDFPSKKQFSNIISQLGKYTSEKYWHRNSPDGINRCIGEGAMNKEIKKIEEVIAAI